MLVAERLLIIDEHLVHAPATEFPVLKAIVQEQRVAAESLDGVATAFHAVLVHQHDDVSQVRGEHVGLVTGGFGVEQQGFAVGNNARRRAVLAEEKFVDQALGQGRGFRAIAAREDRHGAALVAQFAGEFFHDRRLAGAAHGEVANGDDLHAERRVAEDAADPGREPPEIYRGSGGSRRRLEILWTSRRARRERGRPSGRGVGRR